MTTRPAEDRDTLAPDDDPAIAHAVQDPPRTLWGTLTQLGPGLVIAGSIVGSGELIATTKSGAQAGISLLWLIVVGCLIKVFVQIELGRHSITRGETTLSALNQFPGRLGPVNWILWFWLLMMAASMAQLGGIVGGVGEALALTFPLTGDYKEAIAAPAQKELEWYLRWKTDLESGEQDLLQQHPEQQQRIRTGVERLRVQLEQLGPRGTKLLKRVEEGEKITDPWTWDDRYWTLAIGLVTIAMLYNGKYNTIQNLSTALVVAFTFITIGNVISLQCTQQWSLSTADFIRGFSFRLPPGDDPWKPLATALATFGIIGVGATELITYPYWCIEKGYAKYTGPWENTDAWLTRAKGWLRVMHYDAFLSMIVYTIATVAFYLLGVTVLYREGRDPNDMRMVSTIAAAYVPVFGEYAQWLFLLGAFAVLYSTYIVASAGHARVFTDAAKVFYLIPKHSQQAHDTTLRILCVVVPGMCVVLHWLGTNPVEAIMFAGLMQAAMLPMIAAGALYHRYRSCDPRLAPAWWWDLCLIISFLGLLVAGVWGSWSKILDLMRELRT